jgi:hypothetical protein
VRRCLSESRVRERVQRLRELAQLARDEGEPFLLLGGAIRALELVRYAVEPPEERVELPVADVLAFHDAELYERWRRSHPAK